MQTVPVCMRPLSELCLRGVLAHPENNIKPSTCLLPAAGLGLGAALVSSTYNVHDKLAQHLDKSLRKQYVHGLFVDTSSKQVQSFTTTAAGSRFATRRSSSVWSIKHT